MCYLMCWRCVIVPVTGHNGELHMKQEARADFAAMSRDHVTEEDIETFRHVQETAVQVRELGKMLNIFHILDSLVIVFYFFIFFYKSNKKVNSTTLAQRWGQI